MSKLVLLVAIFMAELGFAADGPQNTGTLTIQSSTGSILTGQLQIDRKVLIQIAGEISDASDSLIQKIFAVHHGDLPCKVGIKSQLASAEVLTVLLDLDCSSTPMEVEVSVVRPEELPDNFSLGVRTAAGHFSLDRSNSAVRVIVNQTYLYFKSGLGFLGFSELPDQIMLNRQAALWWGGAHRLPSGFGYLLLIAVFAGLSLGLSQKLWTFFGSLFLLVVPAFLILDSSQAQVVHSLLYVSHGFYLSLAVLAWASSRGKHRDNVNLLIVLILLTSLIYGVEISTMLWPLERPEVSGRLNAVIAFVLGLNLVSWAVVGIFLVLGSLLRIARITPPFVMRLISGQVPVYLIMLSAIYLFVSAFVRVRI